MPGPCYYVLFRKTSGAEPELLPGQIIGNHCNIGLDYDVALFTPKDSDYGSLEISPEEFNAIQDNLRSGSYGKHVDNPETDPVLADGDPA